MLEKHNDRVTKGEIRGYSNLEKKTDVKVKNNTTDQGRCML